MYKLTIINKLAMNLEVIMKTFTATEARNRFGEFLDAGMVGGVKIVRNSRTLGYFVPERQYREWSKFSPQSSIPVTQPTVNLSAQELDALTAFCAGEITSSEVRAELKCERRRLIELVASQGLKLPHLSHLEANRMAIEALQAAGLGQSEIGRNRESFQTAFENIPTDRRPAKKIIDQPIRANAK